MKIKLVNHANHGDICTEDWISALPDSIIHHILSLLPKKDVARTSSLSNRWQSVHAYFPVLDFYQSHFAIPSDLTYYVPLEKSNPALFATYNNFIQHVDTKLLGFCTSEQNLDLLKFTLSMDLVDMELASVVDKWIDLAIQNGVKELHLNIRNLSGRNICSYNHAPKGYPLPQTVFVAGALTTLGLNHCVFKLDDEHAQLNLHSLRKLSLEFVHTDDPTIKQLISSCLSMEEIILICNPGFKNLHIFGLVKLEHLFVRLGSDDHLQSIHLETPSLQTFHIDSTFRGDKYPCTINMDACHGLKTLDFETNVVKGMLFHQFSSKFPFLVRLNLAFCRWIERLEISSHHLQTLKINRCDNLVELLIDTPYLVSLEFVGIKSPSIHTINVSCPWNQNFCPSTRLYSIYSGMGNPSESHVQW